MISKFKLILAAATCCCFLPAFQSYGQAVSVRIGYFPNITHAHALIAQNMAAEGNGWFEARIPGMKLEWVSFNAGPSAMEALFAKAVDITYVGPNPALNAHIRSQGRNVRVVSGAVRGGAALVVQQESTLKNPQDFRGKSIATPQLGNTQDIACRDWFIQAGLSVTMTGGDLAVVPTPNSSILPLFGMKRIEAAWTVEPWVSRLEKEAGGKIIHSEPAGESITTILACSEEFRSGKHALLRRITEAHMALTQWILENPEEAQTRVANELTRQTKREFPMDLVTHAWPRLVFDNAIGTENFAFSLKAAQSAGFIKGDPDISALVISP